ncbi:flagellar hook-length control protein FliK [Pseudomonas sp. v388]|uniref:flagellar hook-length control protein FliK n=1 Tax=Pseudomonas sp. v388 TaxID=2479849 RepID=UPI000F76F552|nr:flagellar hook-length control protein FliK [Pseudomonas sp. v388]RRV07416.1 flagellar hook-length control protein FliK [Pseudomonas sp. v388]
MALATNVLLQANTTAASKSSAANNPIKSADTSKDGASSFSNVYEKQARDKVATHNDAPVKPARDKAAPEKDKPVAGKDKTDNDPSAAGPESTVADSGKGLPAESAGSATDQQAGEDQTGADGSVDPALLGALNADGLDPALQALAAQAAPAVPAAAAAQADDNPALALLATTPATAVAEEAFDPDADPLKDLPAVQLALESANAKTHFTPHNNQPANNVPVDPEADPGQNLANNLAALTQQQASDESSTESSDKSFSGLLGEGLKDVSSAAGDTRVDNFAERLAALSQAAQPARTATPTAPLLSQPLAMHQSGWSEGIVERVMYLSSQNLKSAEIKLEPAELGRLDIRVNMAPDQQTQVTFMSAHLGVRDALESQMARLRESFTQQGLGQVDVNVSDQSQQQAQQQAQEQASRAQRGGRSSGASGSDSGDDSAIADAAAPVSQPAARVIGTSEIDYYA